MTKKGFLTGAIGFKAPRGRGPVQPIPAASSLQKAQTTDDIGNPISAGGVLKDCGNHDWRESMANPRIQWCSKCRQRQMLIKGRWVRAPMSAPKSK